MKHRIVRVRKCDGAYNLICNVCHKPIMERCSEQEIKDFITANACHMVGDCGDLSFYNGPAIAYMEIKSPEQFMEYCSKVERVEMPLEAAKYLLEEITGSKGQYYVSNDILYVMFGVGTTLEGSYSIDLNHIREEMDEEIIGFELYLDRMKDNSENADFYKFVMSGEDELMVGDCSLEELEMTVKTYHEMFDTVWDEVNCNCELNREEEIYE